MPLQNAKWITCDENDEVKCPVFYRSAYERDLLADAAGKSVHRAADITKAVFYATALGIYVADVNGRRIGDAFFAPGWTAYEKGRLLYQEYDVTKEVREELAYGGELRISIHTAPGWYAGFLNGNGERHFYGDRPAVRAALFLCFSDETMQRLVTDETWHTTRAAVIAAEFYHGETYDMRWMPKWDPATGLVSGGEHPAKLLTFSKEKAEPHLTPQECEPVRVTERMKAKRIFVTPKEELVIDFGQNMAGFVEVRLPHLDVSSEAETSFADCGTLTISHAEVLDRDGNFYTENLRTAKAIDTYIYKEESADVITHPDFTYHGFRYIKMELKERAFPLTFTDEGELSSVNGEPAAEFMSRFTALSLHTDLRRIGYFRCDNPDVNRLHENILWGMKSNFVDIPTDCPQRDERLGWTGDAQIFSQTAMTLYDTKAFYTKWLRDMVAESDIKKGVPHLVPDISDGSIGTSIWGDAATVIPWRLYLAYGDKELLKEQYPLMKLWVDYITAQCGSKVLWQGGFQRGDWLGLDAPQYLSGSMNGGTDKDLLANIYYAVSTRYVRDAAKELGFSKDAALYDKRYQEIVDALLREYVTETGRVVSETQTACAMLLHFDLVTGSVKERIIKTLADALFQAKNHLTTGFVGTAFLLHSLSENGMHDLAAEVFFKRDYPGWFYAVDKGATTIWERWDSLKPDGSFDESGMNSFNHYTYGAVADWLYQKVAGISPLAPGYKKIKIAPMLTKGMTEAEASIDTPYGRVKSRWICKKYRITMDVTVPEGTEAKLILPDSGKEQVLLPGEHHFKYETKLSTEPEMYGKDTTVKEILSTEQTAEIFYRYLPEMEDSPMMAFVSKKTLGELSAMSPESAKNFEGLLKELNGLQEGTK